MTVTLCIETSTAHCSLALAVDDRVLSEHERLLRRHNEQVLPMLDRLYKQAGATPRDTQLIGFGAGPGLGPGPGVGLGEGDGVAGQSALPVQVLVQSVVHFPPVAPAG